MFLNIAAYRFVDLDCLTERRQWLRELGSDLGVQGTILLAPEGINLFLSAPPAAIEGFLAALERDPALAGLRPHRSESQQAGFNRYRVRLKREVITYRRDALRPAQGRAPSISAATLAQWLDQGGDDEGRPLRLVDTRNRFEVTVGSFSGALSLDIEHFTDLPAALATHQEALRGHRLVTFCTGGIRCEKAALGMLEDGFENVVQLDRGVLGWFDAFGARHWEGELFVFDRRISLTPELKPGHWRQVYPGRGLVHCNTGVHA